MILLPVALVVLGIFAIVGLFFGVFFATIVFQRLIQRHVHLLAMRSETQRVMVVDLAAGSSRAFSEAVPTGAAQVGVAAMGMRGRGTSQATTEGLACAV